MFEQTVLETQHYTDRLFRFRITRPAGFRFRSGEFVMIGLPGDNGKPLLRAYSIASPAWDDNLEFFSIKVPDGPLTSRLQIIGKGDTVILGKKSTGTLVLDALRPGKTLYMLSTGTGIAPFASLIREPETFERFDKVVLCHTTREVSELQYGLDLVSEIAADAMLSEVVGDKLVHFTSVTREDYPVRGRITALIEDGSLFETLGTGPFDPTNDRVMICGSMEMLRDCAALCEQAGLVEGSNNEPGDYVIEKAFAE